MISFIHSFVSFSTFRRACKSKNSRHRRNQSMTICNPCGAGQWFQVAQLETMKKDSLWLLIESIDRILRFSFIKWASLRHVLDWKSFAMSHHAVIWDYVLNEDVSFINFIIVKRSRSGAWKTMSTMLRWISQKIFPASCLNKDVKRWGCSWVSAIKVRHTEGICRKSLPAH